jgi:hypothetical protein
MSRITFNQLRVFIAVAERQHVTRAAEALNLEQSAVSTATAALDQMKFLRHKSAVKHPRMLPSEKPKLFGGKSG